MGMIEGLPLDISTFVDMSKGLVLKDIFFNEVLTLEQQDIEKWSEPIFNFKFEKDDEWYLGTFYIYRDEEMKNPKLTLAVSKFIEK